MAAHHTSRRHPLMLTAAAGLCGTTLATSTVARLVMAPATVEPA
ncbi:hypothetical protein ABZ379_08530 [Streptomyces canus]